MPKVIQSPIKRYQGSVTIADPLTLPQAKLIEDAFRPPASEDIVNDRVFLSIIDERQLPAVFACVEKWELSGMPEDLSIENFPASPRKDTHALVDFIFDEIKKVYFGEAEVPNE